MLRIRPWTLKVVTVEDILRIANIDFIDGYCSYIILFSLIPH